MLPLTQRALGNDTVPGMVPGTGMYTQAGTCMMLDLVHDVGAVALSGPACWACDEAAAACCRCMDV